MLGHPVLVMAEEDLHPEGLLEDKYDWYVQWASLDLSTLNQERFKGVFEGWKREVEQHQRSKQDHPNGTVTKLDPSGLTVGQLIGALKTGQLWAVVVAIFTAGSAMFFFASSRRGPYLQPSAIRPSAQTSCTFSAKRSVSSRSSSFNCILLVLIGFGLSTKASPLRSPQFSKLEINLPFTNHTHATFDPHRSVSEGGRISRYAYESFERRIECGRPWVGHGPHLVTHGEPTKTRQDGPLRLVRETHGGHDSRRLSRMP